LGGQDVVRKKKRRSTATLRWNRKGQSNETIASIKLWSEARRCSWAEWGKTEINNKEKRTAGVRRRVAKAKGNRGGRNGTQKKKTVHFPQKGKGEIEFARVLKR